MYLLCSTTSRELPFGLDRLGRSPDAKSRNDHFFHGKIQQGALPVISWPSSQLVVNPGDDNMYQSCHWWLLVAQQFTITVDAPELMIDHDSLWERMADGLSARDQQWLVITNSNSQQQ